jgi:hypothetical protein
MNQLAVLCLIALAVLVVVLIMRPKRDGYLQPLAKSLAALHNPGNRGATWPCYDKTGKYCGESSGNVCPDECELHGQIYYAP